MMSDGVTMNILYRTEAKSLALNKETASHVILPSPNMASSLAHSSFEFSFIHAKSRLEQARSSKSDKTHSVYDK